MSYDRRLLWCGTLLCLILWSASALPSEALIEHAKSGLATRQDIVEVPPDASPSRIIKSQVRNPTGILAVLLIIGGETVQKACAQLVAGLRLPYGERGTDNADQKYFSFTPVAFSFGWVGYAFSTLASAFSDGALMPVADVPGLVLTVGGQWKNNENWVIGRLLRDLEMEHKRELEGQTKKGGMGIYFYKSKVGAGKPNRDRIWWLFILAYAAQFGLAVGGPFLVHSADRRNWTVLMITAAGTALALLTGSMPQWGEEKFSARRVTKNSGQRYILTRGNGHAHVFVIEVIKDAYFKNLDDMATRRPFRSSLTRVAIVVLAILWIFLLTIVGGLEEDGWFLLGIGLVGMAHNVLVANRKRLSAAHGLPLVPEGPDSVDLGSVFDALLEIEFGRDEGGRGIGSALRPIFLPAGLKPDQEKIWAEWDEKRKENDELAAQSLRSKEDNGTPQTNLSSTVHNASPRIRHIRAPGGLANQSRSNRRSQRDHIVDATAQQSAANAVSHQNSHLQQANQSRSLTEYFPPSLADSQHCQKDNNGRTTLQPFQGNQSAFTGPQQLGYYQDSPLTHYAQSPQSAQLSPDDLQRHTSYPQGQVRSQPGLSAEDVYYNSQIPDNIPAPEHEPSQSNVQPQATYSQPENRSPT